MYAIIQTGGKQYCVEKGDIIDVELLGCEDEAAVEFDTVLFVNDGTVTLVGTPVVDGYRVTGKVLGTEKGPKVFAYKYKRRQNYHRNKGHRQKYSRVEITDISQQKAGKEDVA